jgi:hypothetical protein
MRYRMMDIIWILLYFVGVDFLMLETMGNIMEGIICCGVMRDIFIIGEMDSIRVSG